MSTTTSVLTDASNYISGLSAYTRTYTTFSGCDMVCSIQLSMPDGTEYTRVVGSLQTITYSIFQDKQAVRSIGSLNAKDYTYGPRTIAGTLIFTVFDKHWAYFCLNEYQKRGNTNLNFIMDELPPMQITISAVNEYGHKARLALYGVRMISEGQVMSINDVYTENTYEFVATDIDYLNDGNMYISASNIKVSQLPSISSGDIASQLPSVSTEDYENPNITIISFDYSKYNSIETLTIDVEKERRKNLDSLADQVANGEMTYLEYGRNINKINSFYNNILTEAKKHFD